MKVVCSILLVLMLLSCNDEQKPAATIVVDSTGVQLSAIEEVTAAVSVLLPAPNMYNVKQAKKWYDASGENWLVLYETGSFIPKGNTMASAKLSAVLFIKTDSGFVPRWKMNDFINDCGLDVVCSFYDEHLSITDIDSNGMAEIMMVYAKSCKGDVSPNEKKLLLYEGSQKYTIRGEELMIMGKDTLGGIMNRDAFFQSLPQVIQEAALKHWEKFGFHKYP